MTETQVDLIKSIIKSLRIVSGMETDDVVISATIDCAICSLELLIRGEPSDDNT